VVGQHREPKQHENDVGQSGPFVRAERDAPVQPLGGTEQHKLVHDDREQAGGGGRQGMAMEYSDRDQRRGEDEKFERN
jgi:hypothetical protein